MKKTMKLGVFLLLVGAVMAVLALVVAKPGDINWQRTFLHDLTRTKTVSHDISPAAENTGAIQGVTVTTNDYDIIVTGGDHYGVVETDNSDSSQFQAQIVDNRLVVSSKQKHQGTTLSGLLQIKVTVPTNANLTNLDLNSKNGDIQVNDLHVDQVNVVDHVGLIHLEGVTVNDGGTISNDYGDINLVKSNLPALEAESRLGDASLKGQYQVTYGDSAKLKVTTVKGDVHLV